MTSLADLGSRAVDLQAHYTDVGILPRAMLASSFWPHFWSGGIAWQALLFGLAAGASITLILGWKSRWMAGLLALLLWSLHARNPQVLFSADTLLRWLMLLATLIPLNGAWNLQGKPAQSLQGLPAAIPLGLMMALYGVGGLLKSGAWYSGEAVAMALRIQHYAGPLAGWLLERPQLCQGLTWFTLAAELATPLLLLVPRWRVRAGLVAFWLLTHAGFSMGLSVGLFPLVAWSAWFLLLPAQLFGERLPALRPGPLNRCASGVLLAILALTNLHSLGWSRPSTRALGPALEHVRAPADGLGGLATPPRPLRKPTPHGAIQRSALELGQATRPHPTLRRYALAKSHSSPDDRPHQPLQGAEGGLGLPTLVPGPARRPTHVHQHGLGLRGQWTA